MQYPARLLRTVILLLASFSLVACGKKVPSESEATLPELDRALQSVAMAKGGFPTQVEDLSGFLALQGKRLPVPPTGKKYAIDSTNRTVVLVDK